MVGFAGAICVFGVVGWLIMRTDAEWHIIALSAFVTLYLVVWALYSLAKVTWRVVIRAKGIYAVKTFTRWEYEWSDIIEARLRNETTWIIEGIPFIRHPVIEFTPARGRKIMVCLNRSEFQELLSVDGFENDSGESVPLQKHE